MTKEQYWEHLANGPETLCCVYMGVKRLPEICQLLIKHGRSIDTPALVHMGTSEQQITVTGTLSTIVEKSHQIKIQLSL